MRRSRWDWVECDSRDAAKRRPPFAEEAANGPRPHRSLLRQTDPKGWRARRRSRGRSADAVGQTQSGSCDWLKRSVAGAADTLNKTPSAVSHALARLRDKVGDPLMVKVGGKMQASPFALQLIEDVQPILRSIKRVLELPEPFDPATSDRVFRMACPASSMLLSKVAAQIQATAPGVTLEWLAAPRDVYSVAPGRSCPTFSGAVLLVKAYRQRPPPSADQRHRPWCLPLGP